MSKKKKLLVCHCAFFILFFSTCAMAAKTSRHDKLIIRPRPNYSAKGIKLGAFILSPHLEIGGEHKDNIYSTQILPRQDIIIHVKPSFLLQSNWNNHSLSFAANGDTWSYQRYTKEDQKNYSFAMLGKLDVVRNSFAKLNLLYSQQTEKRGDPDVLGAPIRPVQYQIAGGIVGYEHKSNRIRLNLDDNVQHITYDNGTDHNGNTLHYLYRNRLINESSFRIGYEVNPNYEAYFRTSFNVINYDEPVDYGTQGPAPGNKGLQRSSRGYKSVMGVALDLTGKLTGDLYAGYQTRTYDDPQLQPLSGNVFGLGLKWKPTGLTTISPNFDRSIGETAQVGVSGSLITAFTVKVDHELYRHLILSANAGYNTNEYIGNHRTDTLYTAGYESKYLLNSNFYLKSGYQYTKRISTTIGSDYQNNSVYLTLGCQL